MKDNLPNYLNHHNIDPSRIEPAHIDTPPGNDSIRPGMNIGTVAVVGKGRPKLQLPTMSNAEAIEVLKHIETDIYGRIAIGKAIDALNSPWVKTADRLPTEAELLCQEATPNPVIYYTDGQPYVPVGGLEIVNHPLVDKLAEYDRHEKYVLPRLLAQVKALGVTT